MLKKLIQDNLSYFEKKVGLDLKYLLSGSFWLFSSSIILGLISFAVLWLLANNLTQEGFGFYQFFISVITILSIFALPGMRTSIVVSAAEKKDGTYPYLISKRMVWSLLGSLGLVITAIYFYVVRGTYWELFLLAALIFPFLEGYKLYHDYFNGRKQFKRTSVYNVVSKLITWVPVAVVIYLVTKNIYAIIVIYLITQAGFHIYGHLTAKKSLRNNIHDTKAYKFGWLINVNYGLNLIGHHVDKLIVTYYFGFVTLAGYGLLRQLGDLMLSFSGIVKTLIFPKISELGKTKSREVINKKIWVVVLVTIIIAIASVIIINPIIKLLFNDYSSIILYAQILFVVLSLDYISTVFVSYFSAQRNSKVIIGETLSYNIIKIGGFLLMIPTLGLLGGVLSFVIADTWKLLYNTVLYCLDKN